MSFVVLALPSQPNDKSDPNPAGSGRQPQDGRVNKKEYRAQQEAGKKPPPTEGAE